MSHGGEAQADPAATPDLWAAALPQPRVLSSEASGWRAGLVRRWTGGQAHISQPPIDHHYVVLHLGGPKRVTRAGAGRTVHAQVTPGALTLVPAGTRYEWVTEGVIDFAHLYVHPSRLNNLIAAKFDRDPSTVTLDEAVGFEDPLLSRVMLEMLDHVGAGGLGANGYLDALFEAALANLAHRHSSLGKAVRPARHALAPLRLRRVLEAVEARLSQPLALGELAQVAGLSRFHFSRAFHVAMGEPPLAYVARRRIEVAKRLLRASDAPVAEVARRSGHASSSAFATAFRRGTGLSPSQFRRQL